MSQIKQMRHEKSISGRKDTRWDRIRKRYVAGLPPSISLKTDAVRRFIDMDFIGKANERELNGEKEARPQLNPALVMDLRHEMFRKMAPKLPLATLAHSKNDSCVAHNVVVEERYIVNELNKFRQQLQKNQQRYKGQMKRLEQSMQVDNEELKRSLQATSKHIEDFYVAPVEALQELNELCDQAEHAAYQEPEAAEQPACEATNNSVEACEAINSNVEACEATNSSGEASECDQHVLKIAIRTPSPLTTSDEVLERIRDAAEEHQRTQKQTRCVHFEDDLEVRKYQRENSTSSNTSDGIDSVISDLAEEALMELQMEEAAREQNVETVTVTTTPTDETQAELPEKEEIKQLQILQIAGVHVVPPVPPIDNRQLLVIQGASFGDHNGNADKGETHLVSTPTDDDEEESTSNHEQNLIIEQLFQSRAQTKVATMRKYFLKWIHYTTISKIEHEQVGNKNDRVHLINAFLDQIRKEKVRHRQRAGNDEPKVAAEAAKNNKTVTVQVTKKYQNKIKMQQDIIDLQRLKLERQERVIMELKLNKLSDEAKEARQELKNELKAVIHSGDPKAKAKAKCLQIIGDLRDMEEDELARLQGKALVPKFLQQMQERALERSVRHEQARQRRLLHDAEREAQKIAVEEAKRLEDEEAKRMRIEVLKERRRQEKMAKILKERERQRALENHRKSQEFCRRLLLRRIGMEGFKRLLQRKRDNQRKCETLRRQHYKRNYFMAWHSFCVLLHERKLQRAENLHHKIMKRQTLAAWRSYIIQERIQFQVAVDWHELKLSERVFHRWHKYSTHMHLIEETKLRQATCHHEWHLKWKVLDCWQRLPQILQLEKETEERRQRWRMKIWELLPDYTPSRDDFLIN